MWKAARKAVVCAKMVKTDVDLSRSIPRKRPPPDYGRTDGVALAGSDHNAGIWCRVQIRFRSVWWAEGWAGSVGGSRAVSDLTDQAAAVISTSLVLDREKRMDCGNCRPLSHEQLSGLGPVAVEQKVVANWQNLPDVCVKRMSFFSFFGGGDKELCLGKFCRRVSPLILTAFSAVGSRA